MNYPHNISLIDIKLNQLDDFAAAYLMVHEGKAAFIETGTNHSAPDLLAALKAAGLKPSDVLYIMPTHVHLDHAGGAGLLMQECPNAKLVIHPRGAFHMGDPSKLQAGAEAVYGKAGVAEAYGELIPIDEQRMIIADDNFVLDFNGRELLFLDTPGHARHHYCIYDELSSGVFSGDTFGLSYRQFDQDDEVFLFPTTTPVQFDPEALKESISRIAALKPERVFLTHYGMIENIQPYEAKLHAMIDQLVSLAKKYANTDNRQEKISQAMMQLFLTEARKTNSALSSEEMTTLLTPDVTLNTAGIEFWLDHKK